MARWIILLALAFAVTACTRAQDIQEIESLTTNHLNGVLKETRESGVTSIDVNSKDIDTGWNKAVVALNITFNVYIPPTQERRQDNDIAIFYFKKSKGEWKITETKYEKTRW